MRLRHVLAVLSIMLMPACAGVSRSWTSCTAENFGSDWIVVQYDINGQPFNCWKLEGAAIVNEEASDGIYWQDRRSGHLVHLSGWYNRVQVEGKEILPERRLDPLQEGAAQGGDLAGEAWGQHRHDRMKGSRHRVDTAASFK